MSFFKTFVTESTDEGSFGEWLVDAQLHVVERYFDWIEERVTEFGGTNFKATTKSNRSPYSNRHDPESYQDVQLLFTYHDFGVRLDGSTTGRSWGLSLIHKGGGVEYIGGCNSMSSIKNKLEAYVKKAARDAAKIAKQKGATP